MLPDTRSEADSEHVIHYTAIAFDTVDRPEKHRRVKYSSARLTEARAPASDSPDLEVSKVSKSQISAPDSMSRVSPGPVKHSHRKIDNRNEGSGGTSTVTIIEGE